MTLIRRILDEWKAWQEHVALDRVAQEYDGAVLSRIGRTRDSARVRNEALIKLAMVDISRWRNALERLKDNAALARLAKPWPVNADPRWRRNYEHERDVRRAALRRLHDQHVLAEVARGDRDEDIRIAAIENLTDQSVIIEMLSQGQLPGVQFALVQNLADEAMLVDFALGKGDEFVRSAAVRRVRKPESLARIAIEGNGSFEKVEYVDGYREVQRIPDSALLALKRLTDPALLQTVAQNSGSEEVRQEALRTLEMLRP
jgi:hypothetical protein